ncbi:MAG: hypothetical protein RLZZ91_1494 [Bacteroidota bacterium]|jgi:uncharacterized membrane protein YqaE (UPF0057 family)
MKRNLFFALTAMTMLLASCSIQQRVYQPGLYIEWKGNHEAQTKTDAVSHEQTAQVENTVAVENEALASTVTNVESPPSLNVSVQEAVVVEKSSKLSKQEVKQAVKELKQEVSALVSRESAVASVESSSAKNQNGGEPESWVYVLLILLVPFGTTIAMYLHEGSWTKKVTANLILTLLCVIPGLIHALVNIFGKK